MAQLAKAGQRMAREGCLSPRCPIPLGPGSIRGGAGQVSAFRPTRVCGRLSHTALAVAFSRLAKPKGRLGARVGIGGTLERLARRGPGSAPCRCRAGAPRGGPGAAPLPRGGSGRRGTAPRVSLPACGAATAPRAAAALGDQGLPRHEDLAHQHADRRHKHLPHRALRACCCHASAPWPLAASDSATSLIALTTLMSGRISALRFDWPALAAGSRGRGSRGGLQPKRSA